MGTRANGGARRAAVLATLTILGCGSAMRAGGSADVLDAELTPRSVSSRSILTRGELAATNAETTLEAIERLRPEFLLGHARPPGLAWAPITVYLNDRYEGDVSLLNTIPLSAIREVNLLRPTEALIRFGTTCRCPGGVILVDTRARRDQRP